MFHLLLLAFYFLQSASPQPGCPITTSWLYYSFHLEIGPLQPIIVSPAPNPIKPAKAAVIGPLVFPQNPTRFNLTDARLSLADGRGHSYLQSSNGQVLFATRLVDKPAQWIAIDSTDCDEGLELIPVSQGGRKPLEVCVADVDSPTPPPGGVSDEGDLEVFVREKPDVLDGGNAWCRTAKVTVIPLWK